jgi:hypothetical protein
MSDMEKCPTCRGHGFLPPVKTCANEACRKEFRWQEGRSESDQYRAKGVIYCSNLCARAQYQREKRRRDREAAR